MHDAAEAYLIDVARPVKIQPDMKFYRDAEDTLLTCIARRFGMVGDEPPKEVNDIDGKIAVNEARVLLPQLREDLWFGRPGLDDVEFEEISKHAIGWIPEDARFQFMKRFRILFGSAT